MSKGNQKFASTLYNQERKKQLRTPPKSESLLRKTQKSYEVKNKIVDNHNFQDIISREKDERFRYLIKHGELKKIENSGSIIFAQLPQIPNVWVCYRRPTEREVNLEKLNLDSLELNHVPLLEGEEKLKMLTFQHNRITRIENLISLPNILYIDLYDNLIKDIENLSVPTLKVLLLPKNQISKIKNVTELVKLEVLDLHSNKITKIQGFGLLNSLRILNLAHNQIIKLENLDNLSSLHELNLKSNLIMNVQNLQKLQKMQKIFLSNNRIEIKNFDQCQLSRLASLKELALENNPCSKDKIAYLRNIMKYLPGLKILDGKAPTLLDEQESNNKEEVSDDESNHEEVKHLIAEQWTQEKQRILQLETSNAAKREYIKTTCITGGHAQIEDESILFIYGNSYDVVLSNSTFQESVEKIRFEFIFIEFLIEQNILGTLKKFKKLKILQFKETYILSLLQIAKLENLVSLKSINIEPAGNPITTCTFLKEFIIYRFPGIIQINKEDIKESDRLKAKTLFQNFDKVLQIPEKVYGVETMRNYSSEETNAKKDRNYVKTFNKILNEAGEHIVDRIANKTQTDLLQKQELESLYDLSMQELIKREIFRQGL